MQLTFSIKVRIDPTVWIWILNNGCSRSEPYGAWRGPSLLWVGFLASGLGFRCSGWAWVWRESEPGPVQAQISNACTIAIDLSKQVIRKPVLDWPGWLNGQAQTNCGKAAWAQGRLLGFCWVCAGYGPTFLQDRPGCSQLFPAHEHL